MTQVNIDIEDFIEHFGKMGMKWGVRNRTPVRTSSDFKKTAPLRNRKTRELTNKQLQNVNARVKLEDTYRRAHPGRAAKGRAAVATIIGLAGTAATIYNLQHNPAFKAAVSAGAKMMSQRAAKAAMKLPYQQLTLF